MKIKIIFLGKHLNVADMIHTISAFLGALTIYLALEYSIYREIPWRALFLFFVAGGALVAELLTADPIANTVSTSLEIFGIIILLIIFLINFEKIYRYSEIRRSRFISLIFGIGFIAFITSLITNVVASYFNLPPNIIDVWEFQYMLGILLLSFVLYKRPFVIIEAYARPKLLCITDKDGKVCYSIILDRNIKRADRKLIEDYIEGLPLLSSELLGLSTKLESIKFKDLEILVLPGREIIGYFLVQKSSRTVFQMLKIIVEEFEEVIYPIIQKEKPEEKEIEILEQFDYKIKTLISELTI